MKVSMNTLKGDNAGSLKTDKLLLTYGEVAEAVGVSVKTVKRWVTDGVLVPIRISHRVSRFDPQDVVKRLKKRGAMNVSRQA